jgi:hypothetical protein
MAYSRRACIMAAVAAVASWGCATERPPINRVQPNALEKSFFVGEDLQDPSDDPEFYTAATVIDMPYGSQHGLFSGLTGGLARIKWEISEDVLLARRTYEHIEDVDGRGARTTNDGLVVAAFAIDSHFDIKRGYNPSTGEELNVIEENTTDSPWYERKFMRVDWSQNLISSSLDWDPLAFDSMLGPNYEVEPLAYYVEDPNHPDAPVFDAEAGYFDITNKVFVTPATLTVEGITLPTCFWYGAWVEGGDYETGVCESTELKIRMSFLRVPQAGEPGYSDYLPQHYDGARMSAFGAFYVERKGYDAQYGVIDNRWYRFLQRFNIWERSSTDVVCATQETYASGLDPNRDDDHDGTDDECQDAGAGSMCNVFRQRCTMPFARRQPRPVVWHYHMGSDDELLFEFTERAVQEWDVALRLAVQAARYVECVRTRTRSVRGIRAVGGAYLEDPAAQANLPLVRASCKTAYPIAGHAEGRGQVDGAELESVRDVLRCWDRHGREARACQPRQGERNRVAALRPLAVLCHNPVRGPLRDSDGDWLDAGDDPACGEPGLVTRVGDLRYHSLNVWSTPESSAPWGFGPSWADPLTGEVIQGSVNVYGAVTDLAARSMLDHTLWYAGELRAVDIATGDYVRDRTAPANSDVDSRRFLMTRQEIDRRLLGLRHASADAMDRVPELRRDVDAYQAMRALQRQLQEERIPPSLAGSNRAEFDRRIELAKDSPIEAQLVGPMWAQAAGIDPSEPMSGTNLELSSPLRLQNAETLMHARAAVHRRLAERGMCLYEAPEPSATPALAKLLARKFPPLGPDATPEQTLQRDQQMYDYIRARIHFGLVLHEMGHTVGLRHNFTGSADKFNYRPQYWQLRTSGGTVHTRCTEPVADGAACVGPRYFDPETPEEIDQSLHTWAFTSVMDYAGDYTQDWMGLGVYDLAASRMVYGDLVEVLDDGQTLYFDPTSRCYPEPVCSMFRFVDYPGGLYGQWVRESNTGRFLHYSEWNDYFDLLRDCHPQDPEPPADWNEQRDGIWDPVFDGQLVLNQRCERMPVDYVAWRDMVPDVLAEQAWVDPKFFTPRRARDAEGRVRMPLSFESDEFVNGWTPMTLARDVGADPYEQYIHFINRYENDHIFDDYRRNRVGFSVIDAYQNALYRRHYMLSYLTQGLSILHDYWFGQLAADGGVSHADMIAFFEGEGGPIREHAIAASLAFDHFIRVITRPHPGPHYSGLPGRDGYLASNDDLIWFDSSDYPDPDVLIPNGTSVAGDDVTFGGRPLTNGLQYGRGYHYFDYVDRVGSFYEKTYAFQAMLNAVYRAPVSFARFDALDGRWRHTNFTNLFAEGMRRALGSMLTEDYALFAPRVAADASGRPILEPDTGYPAEPLGWVSFVKSEGPEICWPSGGAYVCSDPAGQDLFDRARDSVALEPQLGYEIQKFIAFWAHVYLPGSQVLDWVDMMRIYRTGADQDPGYLPAQRVAWTDPETGLRYVAKRYGDEVLFGKTYDRGIAAKMIQWAQQLTERGYELDQSTPFDPDTGDPQVLRDADGRPLVRADPTLMADDPASLTCDDNRACQQLRRYRGLLDFVRDTAAQVGFPEPALNTYSPDE